MAGHAAAHATHTVSTGNARLTHSLASHAAHATIAMADAACAKRNVDAVAPWSLFSSASLARRASAARSTRQCITHAMGQITQPYESRVVRSRSQSPIATNAIAGRRP